VLWIVNSLWASQVLPKLCALSCAIKTAHYELQATTRNAGPKKKRPTLLAMLDERLPPAESNQHLQS
jgi:hypothetical protein